VEYDAQGPHVLQDGETEAWYLSMVGALTGEERKYLLRRPELLEGE